MIDQLLIELVKSEKFSIVKTILDERGARIIMNAKDDAQVENMYGDMMKEAIRAGLY